MLSALYFFNLKKTLQVIFIVKIYVTYTYHFTCFKCTSQWHEACSLCHPTSPPSISKQSHLPKPRLCTHCTRTQGGCLKGPPACSVPARVIPGACSFTHGPWPDEDPGGPEGGWIILIPMEPGLLALWEPVITRVYMGESLRVPSTRDCLDKTGRRLWGGHGVWSLAAGSWSKTGQRTGGTTKALLLFELFKVKCR